MSFFLLEDEILAIHSREVNTIWNALADAGGFFEVITLTAIIIISHYKTFYYY